MSPITESYTWCQFTPAFVLVGIAALILMADAFLPKLDKRVYAVFGAVAAIATGCFMLAEPANLFGFLACVATGLTLLLAYDYYAVSCDSIAGGDNAEGYGEFLALPLVACAGIFCLTQAHDLIMLFVSLEVLTLSSYTLAGYFRRNQGSVEAGIKYLVLGAMSTGLLVFGAAWYFGMTGTFELNSQVAQVALQGSAIGAPAIAGGFLMAVAMLFLGAFFKVGAAPMHVWIPDVYQGAPTPTSSFLAVASKVGGFVVLCTLFAPFSRYMQPEYNLCHVLVWIVALVAAATLLIGNLGAINQNNAKRLLGYSSIGQAGFIIVFFLGVGAYGIGTRESNVFTYLLAYALATIPAFYAIAMVRTQRGSEEISAFRGLAKTNPRTAFLVTVAFASLAGVPLTLGFIAKLKAFLALIDTMTVFDGLAWLLVIMIICAAAGFYYYFKIIRAMYWEKPLPEDKPLQVPGITTAVLAISALASIILGTLPLLITSGS